MSEIKWRFPGNNYTNDNGLDTADMETFKKDAISSLARELCQNSVDARRQGEQAVKMEFRTFEIERGKVRGIDDLEKQIIACKETWSSNTKISKQLDDMLMQIRKQTISCLRISDFNTTGLIGVSGGDNNAWHYLVHGSGISDKGATSGGSKGIGKFATFVNSYFNTVFYSTKTQDGEMGYEGICKLCSAKQEGTSEKTQGIGYFGSSDMNEPIIDSEFNLDDKFYRTPTDYGSDIFIIGFKNQDRWDKDVISMILESFMSAIAFGTLSVKVNDIVLDKNHLNGIVYRDDLINKKSRKSIVSQYLLLTDEKNRFHDVLNVSGLGEADLYSMDFSDNEDYATNGCVMIRYPYMKIKDITKISSIPCSAMCIIRDNQLNSTLRSVENPQHTDWEFKRIEDKDLQNEVKNVYKDLLDQIRNNIFNHLQSSDKMKTDVEGAGEYLPGMASELGSKKDSEKNSILDKPKIEKKKVKTKEININASIQDESGDGIELDTGSHNDDGDDVVTPEGHNEGSGGPIRPGNNPSGGSSGDDGNILVKHAPLRGMKYRFFCLNKKERRYGVVFTSDFDEKESYFSISGIDDSGNKYPVKIEKCKINGADCPIINQKEVKVELIHGQKMKIEMITDQDELFSGEVKMYAYR